MYHLTTSLVYLYLFIYLLYYFLFIWRRTPFWGRRIDTCDGDDDELLRRVIEWMWVEWADHWHHITRDIYLHNYDGGTTAAAPFCPPSTPLTRHPLRVDHLLSLTQCPHCVPSTRLLPGRPWPGIILAHRPAFLPLLSSTSWLGSCPSSPSRAVFCLSRVSKLPCNTTTHRPCRPSSCSQILES